MADVKFARLVGGYVQETIQFDPNGVFHQDVAKQYIPCPEYVEQGWQLIGIEWVAPAVPEPAPTRLPVLSPVQFKMCFTAAERISLKTLRANDPIVDDWMTILDDPRLSGVDLNLASTQAAVDYLIGKVEGFSVERAAQVKVGQVL